MEIKHGKQTRLAAAVGVTPQCLHDYLTGRCNASPSVTTRKTPLDLVAVRENYGDEAAIPFCSGYSSVFPIYFFPRFDRNHLLPQRKWEARKSYSDDGDKIQHVFYHRRSVLS